MNTTYQIILDCQTNADIQNVCAIINLLNPNTKMETYVYMPHIYVPYIFAKHNYDDHKNQINVIFDCDIDAESFVLYCCDVILDRKHIEITFDDKINIEKYIISKHDMLKKYSSYTFRCGNTLNEFKIFYENIFSYGNNNGCMMLEDYCKSEMPTNLYNIDIVYDLPKQYLSNKKIYVQYGKKYSINSLSKYKFAYFTEGGYSSGIVRCFSVKMVDDVVYLKGPFKFDNDDMYYEAAWDIVDIEKDYVEQKNIMSACLMLPYGDKIIWCDTYNYIMNMQNIDNFRERSVKLKIQDDESNDRILYVPLDILLMIDNEYFKLASDTEYMKAFGDKDTSIYFSGNQTIQGFMVFLKHCLDNFDENNAYMNNNFSINFVINSVEDIDLYTYYHRFNKYSDMSIKSNICKEDFAKIIEYFGFDTESHLYQNTIFK